MQQRSERDRRRKFPRQGVLYVVLVASKQRPTQTVRAGAMTEARVHMQHMHVAFLASISLHMSLFFLLLEKHAEELQYKNLIAVVCFDPVILLLWN